MYTTRKGAFSEHHLSNASMAEWMPLATDVHCQYVAERLGTKLRWNLTAAEAEVEVLAGRSGRLAGPDGDVRACL
jgi:hypothetical protein